MDKEQFLTMMKELGCKNKKELAKILNMPYNSVNNWGNVQKFPPYVEPFLNALVKAKKYDEALGSGVDLGSAGSAENVEALRLENVRLREELREYEELKSVLKRVLL
ncbi:helix-turn-helix domain-containing protein [Campylobacter vulpis]|uniref:helix-turn-helix domain-containing protein n=1 Tax=Campylobacter vulpis TaxID=1655500 RepID=UPI000C15B266|nr:helix-turn-helix domain-containing protein [Campylobacter vulpis]